MVAMVAAPHPLDDLIDLLADWLVEEAAREVEGDRAEDDAA